MSGLLTDVADLAGNAEPGTAQMDLDTNAKYPNCYDFVTEKKTVSLLIKRRLNVTLLVIATPEIFRPVSSVANPGMKKFKQDTRTKRAMLNHAHQGSLHRLGLKVLIDRTSKMRNMRSLRARKTIENLSRRAVLRSLPTPWNAVVLVALFVTKFL